MLKYIKKNSNIVKLIKKESLLVLYSKILINREILLLIM